MHKVISLSFALLAGIACFAQINYPNNQAGPVKFADVLSWHNAHLNETVGEEERGNQNGKEIKEGNDHLFEKWKWYWQQHLDVNGYMVPGSVNTLVWEQYLQKHQNHATQRTTSGSYPSDWIFMGPNTTPGGYAGIGRMNVVAFDPLDSNTIYAGAAGGGAWKSTDGGTTWNPCYNNLATEGVADIKVNPMNGNTIYVCTGDGDAGDAYCAGIIVSHDRGTTWSTAGLTWLPSAYYSARTLQINPLDTNTLLLGTNNGLFWSHNAGASWANTNTYSYKQILYNPYDTNVVYASIYAHYPDSSCQILRSANGGHTWTVVTTFTDVQRINLAICPTAPNIVYAIASNNQSGLEGIYASSDTGYTYTATFTNDTSCVNNLLSWDFGLPSTTCGGQGWYDLCIAINPANPANITIGGVNTYTSFDGGYSWQIANTWYYSGSTGVEAVHADKHWLQYHPITGALFEACDGGVYKNYDSVTGHWINLCNGLCATEFYKNAVANSASFVIGGAQDNGTKSISTGPSTDLTGGDGMQPLFNYGDPTNIFYTSFPSGGIDMTRDGGSSYVSITDTIHRSGNWVSPYDLFPDDTATLVLGYQCVWLSANNGISWDSISPNLDTNGYDITVLKIAPTNHNYIYVAYTDYNIWSSMMFYTHDLGATWNYITPPFSVFINDIAVNPRNPNQIWVACSGYDTVNKLLMYDVTTGFWTNQTGSLPNLPVNCILIDTATQTRYIGTDAAVFVWDSAISDWSLYNNNLPAVHVTDLNINYSTGQIWASTFGRGMWASSKHDYPENVKKPNGTAATGQMVIAPNPSQKMFTIALTGMATQEEASLLIVDGTGAIAYQQNFRFDQAGKILVNTSNLPAGFYICELACGNTVYRSKLILY